MDLAQMRAPEISFVQGKANEVLAMAKASLSSLRMQHFSSIIFNSSLPLHSKCRANTTKMLHAFCDESNVKQSRLGPNRG